MSNNEISAILEYFRTEYGWGVRESAKQMGCSPTSLRKWRTSGAPDYVIMVCSFIISKNTMIPFILDQFAKTVGMLERAEADLKIALSGDTQMIDALRATERKETGG